MLTFLHISDTHISGDPVYHPSWVHPLAVHPNMGMEALISKVNRLNFPIDFVLHTGDVCADANEADYHCARTLLGRFQMPVYLIPGNHDSIDLMNDIIDDGSWIHVLRDDRVCINDYHLITLNTNGTGDAHAPTVHERQIDWLAYELQQTAGEPMIVAMHHPLIETGVEWIDQRMRVKNGDQIHQHLARYASQLRGVFYGHIHQPVHSCCDGVMYTTTPSTWYNLQAYPGLQHDEGDHVMSGGFNLVLVRGNRTFLRRYSL